MNELKEIIRDVPDFPKKGIIFKDITTLLGDAGAFKKTVDAFIDRYKGKKIDKFVGIEARGFIIGAPLAYALGAAFVPIRKPGKLPYKSLKTSYALEYGTNEIEIHEDAIAEGEKVVIIDDLLATGGTVEAACKLVEQLGGDIVEQAFIVELGFLKGRDKINKHEVYSLLQF